MDIAGIPGKTLELNRNASFDILASPEGRPMTCLVEMRRSRSWVSMPCLFLLGPAANSNTRCARND